MLEITSPNEPVNNNDYANIVLIRVYIENMFAILVHTGFFKLEHTHASVLAGEISTLLEFGNLIMTAIFILFNHFWYLVSSR